MKVKADFTVKQGATADTLQAILLGPNRLPEDISEATSLRFVMRPIAGGALLVDQTAVKIDDGTEPLRGRADYEWGPTDLDIAGIFKAEFEALWPNDKISKYPSLGWLVIQIDEDNRP
jgi:hypothetical protein